MLTDDEIRRKLITIRHSSVSERCARRTTSLRSVSAAAGLSSRQLYRIVVGLPIGDRARAELSRVLTYDTMTGDRAGDRR
jgi:hypothetical protein